MVLVSLVLAALLHADMNSAALGLWISMPFAASMSLLAKRSPGLWLFMRSLYEARMRMTVGSCDFLGGPLRTKHAQIEGFKQSSSRH